MTPPAAAREPMGMPLPTAVEAFAPAAAWDRRQAAWLATTGLLVFLMYLPDGLVHLKLGKLAYARDVLVLAHLCWGAILLERAGLLLPLARKVWPLALGGLCLIPLILARYYLRDALVHVKWIVLWFDWMLIGYAAWHARPLSSAVRWVAALAILMIVADSMAGFWETRTNQFLLPVDRAGETASGEQLGRSQIMDGTVRAQGMQRSVFAFSNMMGLGILVCTWLSVARSGAAFRLFMWALAAWMFYVAFISGGRSSMLGSAAVMACALWASAFPRAFTRLFPLAALAILLGGVFVCFIGLGETLSFLTSPFSDSSRTFSMTSVWERDAIWRERLGSLLNTPVAWITGIPPVVAITRSEAPIDFADNTLLYLIYHFGVPITLLMTVVLAAAIAHPVRHTERGAYALLAFSLVFVLGEGIARDTLWYFGCMPLFLSLGWMTAVGNQAAARPPASPAPAARGPAGAAALALIFLACAPLSASAETSSDAGFRVVPEAPGGVFLEGENVAFAVVGDAAEGMRWRLPDAAGGEVASGGLAAGAGGIVLGAQPVGFHRLDVGGRRFGFAVVPADIPLQKRFCLDVAGNELVRHAAAINPNQPKNAIGDLAEISRRLGVGSIRDRLFWPGVNPKAGEFDWRHYPEGYAEAAGRGIDTTVVFHAAPQWALQGNGTQPGDLAALHAFAREAARKFQGTVEAWEFWNEPDEHFCSDPAWEYASGQKAAFAGFKAGNPEAAVLIGSNAQHPVPKFFEVVMENGAGDGFDVFNFHTYSSAGALLAMIGKKREFLAAFGQADKPLWLTEIGWRDQENGRVENFLADGSAAFEHDEEQEIRQARFLVQSLVAAAARGVERVFYFLLTPYNEDGGRRPWGLLRWDWTAKPGVAAMATLNAMTGGKTHAGMVAFGSGVAAHLFEDASGVQAMVLWAEEPGTVSVRMPEEGGLQIRGFLGEAIALRADSNRLVPVPVGADPIWVVGRLGLSGSSLPAPSSSGDEAAAQEAPADRELVLGARVLKPLEVKNRVIASPGEADGGPVHLKVWNFSPESRHVLLRDLSTGLRVSGLPESVEAPPGQPVDIPLLVTFEPGAHPDRALRIEGDSPNGRVSRIVVPMRNAGDGLGGATARDLPVLDASLWRPSASSFMKIRPAGDGEGMEFVCWFDKGVERWIYPVFDIPPEGGGLADSAGLSFEIKVVEGGADKAFLMLGARGRQAFQFPYKPDAEWRKVTFIWSDDAPSGFDPASATALKIGMNPKSDTIRYRVRNLQVHGQAQ